MWQIATCMSRGLGASAEGLFQHRQRRSHLRKIIHDCPLLSQRVCSFRPLHFHNKSKVTNMKQTQQGNQLGKDISYVRILYLDYYVNITGFDQTGSMSEQLVYKQTNICWRSRLVAGSQYNISHLTQSVWGWRGGAVTTTLSLLWTARGKSL